MSSPERPVLAIFGPTASGKSAVAEAVARRIPAEIVSADSMQVYRGVPLLTNQPRESTRIVAIWDLDHEASVGEYATLAHDAIDEALAAGRTPVVVGGTGLYLRAALADLEIPPSAPPGLREHYERIYDRLGGVETHALLAARDPAAASAVHPNDRRRVVRALELADAGGTLAPPRSRLWTEDMRHPTLVFGLDVPRDVLRNRIEARTTALFDFGVSEEVQSALRRPVSKTARQIIGLREVIELPRDEAITAITLRTTQYAAYQRKWMRRIPGLIPLDADRPAEEVAIDVIAASAVEITPPGQRNLAS
jgi:tRNA dimethylallyltransferase